MSIVNIKTTKESIVANYVQIMNFPFFLSDKEREIVACMVKHSKDGLCNKEAMKAVREELELDHNDIGTPLRRAKDKGAVEHIKTPGGEGVWKIHQLLIPPAEITEIKFVFVYE
jgi:hypothetical protein